MVSPRKIRIMISSRCMDPITLDKEKRTFSDVRLELKKQLEAETLLGSRIFDVWINEDGVAADGTEDSWTECLKQIDLADIVIVIYNGNAGWLKHSGEIGICHAEMQAVMNSAPGKARFIVVENTDDAVFKKASNRRFKEYFERMSRFRQKAANGEEVIDKAKEAVREAVANLSHLGVREARRGKFSTGDALDWSRLNFEDRSSAIKEVILGALKESYPESSEFAPGIILKPTKRDRIFFHVHGIAASLSNAAARESVGQPFLRDHLLLESCKEKFSGPVHLIGCHKGVSESQAGKILGFNDVMSVDAPFGIYVADNVMKIQLIFIENCRDESTTRHGVQRLFEWFEQTDELENLKLRAASRRKILECIQQECVSV